MSTPQEKYVFDFGSGGTFSPTSTITCIKAGKRHNFDHRLGNEVFLAGDHVYIGIQGRLGYV
jgi:hypothetical protein